MSAGSRSGYRAVIVATLTLVHQPQAVEALERRLRDEILTANLSRAPVSSADERFIVERVLGHGASSVVCRAREIKLDRPIALKLFPGLADDGLARAVKREAQALAKIPHANIVTVHDFGVLKLMPGEHCCFFVAMELGVSLRDWLREAEPTPEKVVATFCRIGEGLAAIHSAGFVYRDFKPENVVLVAGVPKIVDFGLALSAATGSDVAGTRIIGTPAFMSPEALRGRPQDPRSDQFSFAAALWKALCGELPYDGLSHDPAMRGPLRPPRPTMPEQVLPALRRALDPEPARRFPDMAELLAALQPAAESARSSSATARTPALMLEVESTTELVPVRRPAQRRLAPWLAFPAVGMLSVGGVLVAMGFWDDPGSASEGMESADADEAAVIPISPPLATVVAGCPDVAALAGTWTFDASARWAEHAKLLDKVGHYTLDLASDGSPCGLQVDLRKHGNDDIRYPEPHFDRQRLELLPLPPFTGGFAGRFSPKKPGKTAADNSYDFVFIIDHEQLYGYFHARAEKGEQFRGLVLGGRGGAGEAVAGHIPCAARCGAQCLGADAVRECQSACASDVWADVACPAPDPAEAIGLPAKTSECESNAARRYAGRWLVLARDRISHEDRAYEVEIGADGCDIVVKFALERGGGELAGSTGRAHTTGRWEVTLTSGEKTNQVRHEWSLVGTDPAFGEFTARHGKKQLAAGVVAAYRRP